MQLHRSPRVRRISLTVAQLVGATAAATLTAGTAAAESLSRGDTPDRSNSPGISRNGTYGGTGMHSIDPYGYHHRDANQLQQNQHQQNLRELRANPGTAQQQDSAADSATGLTTWTPTENEDGGWAVCRPQASWC